MSDRCQATFPMFQAVKLSIYYEADKTGRTGPTQLVPDVSGGSCPSYGWCPQSRDFFNKTQGRTGRFWSKVSSLNLFPMFQAVKLSIYYEAECPQSRDFFNKTLAALGGSGAVKLSIYYEAECPQSRDFFNKTLAALGGSGVRCQA
ncbi:hypothetical protein J6590_072630 [Homalodisca vitripennis]|nr:hypothetical protein J6590_072630 [Homalodisca vitripennis]